MVINFNKNTIKILILIKHIISLSFAATNIFIWVE